MGDESGDGRTIHAEVVAGLTREARPLRRGSLVPLSIVELGRVLATSRASME